LLYLVLLFAATHLILEGAARFAERYLDAYLWKEQDYLRLFSPANHAGRGRGRLHICGPSEAREGLLPQEIGRVAAQFKAYQSAQSVGTLEDCIVVFSYVERAYGTSAIPEALLIGITTRFIANLRNQPSPLFHGINRYSPLFRVDETVDPPTLEPKSVIESVSARWAILRLQPDRYRRGLFAIASRLATAAVPSLAADRRTWQPIFPAKAITGHIWSPEVSKKHLTEKGSTWARVHDWDAFADRVRVTRDLQWLLEYAARRNIRLFVVNLPEVSWNRDAYPPGRYEAYLAIVQAALGETPFLDLRTFLTDEEFYDEQHPTWQGGIRLSKRVAQFINDWHRDGRQHAGAS
jgi:hypothetical protein